MMKFGNLKIQDNSRKEIYDSYSKCYREKHSIKITNTQTNISKYFNYITESLEYINREKLLENALCCIYKDFEIFEEFKNDVDNFVNEFGYNYKQGLSIYNKTLKSHNRFSSLIDKELIETLSKHYDNY